MDHERFDELKDAYVLDALSERERRELEEYLAAHPGRQSEIDELGSVAGLLALSPQEQDPPPRLRRNIMSVVEAEARRPAASRRTWLAGIGELLRLQNLALGAAVLLLIGLFSWNMVLQGKVQNLQGQVENRQENPVNRMVALEGTGAAQEVQAEVMILEENRAVLMVENMPPAPGDRTYQVWVIEGDDPQPSALFEPREQPVAAVVEDPLNEADAIAVTVEPEGGSPQPTTDPMLIGKL